MAQTLQRMRNSRYNQFRKNVQELAVTLGSLDAGDLTDAQVQYIRQSTEEALQQFHEYNAFRNAQSAFGNVKGT